MYYLFQNIFFRKPKYYNKNGKPQSNGVVGSLQLDDLESKLDTILKSDTPHKQQRVSMFRNVESEETEDIDVNVLKQKMVDTLDNAKTLMARLQEQIVELSEKETFLKDAIVNGL